MDKPQTSMALSSDREEALFRAAVELGPGTARQVFLDQACAGDAALRQRLEALLAAHDQPATVLDAPTEPARPTLKLDLAPEPADDAEGQTIGRYKLLEKVGEGGCGVVHVTEQTQPVRRRVALKVIKLGMDTKQVVARFEAERQALAMMDHPNIAKVLDAGTTGDPQGSAGCQPAVSPTASRPGAESSSASAPPNPPQAACPATPQTGSRRYEPELRAGRPYFVMELVRGIPITHYCDQEKLGTRERLLGSLRFAMLSVKFLNESERHHPASHRFGGNPGGDRAVHRLPHARRNGSNRGRPR